MDLTSVSINNTFYKTLNLRNKAQSYQGRWVHISLKEWINYASSLANLSAMNLNKYLVDFLVNEIFNADYGAGCIYEIYERRRQDEIEIILSTLNLNENEISYFKKNVEYVDDIGSSICEDCGDEFPGNSGHRIHSLAIEARELCQKCFSLCFIE